MRISDWSSDVCSSDLDGHPISASRQKLRIRTLHSVGWQNLVIEWPSGETSIACLALLSIWQRIPTMNLAGRSAERRVGQVCVRKCRSRWSPYHTKKRYDKH